jgi:hypothetical protein
MSILKEVQVFEVERHQRLLQLKGNQQKTFLKTIRVCMKLKSNGKECKMFYATLQDLKFDHGLWR